MGNSLLVALRFGVRLALLAGSIGLFGLFVLSLPARANDWYVTTGGTGAQNGSNWDNAFPTITAGLKAAQSGESVYVWVGTYHERITLKPGVKLLGGHFFGGMRIPFWSIIDGDSGGTVVTVPAGATSSTILEGFTVQNGTGTMVSGTSYGGGIYCGDASPVLRWNLVTACSAMVGGGIFLSNSSAEVSLSHFTNNHANVGGGIRCLGGAPAIGIDTFQDNDANEYSGALAVSGAPGIVIGCNVFKNNRTPGSASAVSLDGGWFLNNTLLGNAGTAKGALTVVPGGTATIGNTIVASNSSGIRVEPGANAVLAFNDVWGNTAGNYSGVADQTGANGNISKDPALEDPQTGDFTPCFGSPCVDKGFDAIVPAGALDYYARARISGVGVDIGAAELVQPAPRQPIYVNIATGNNSNDGLSWATAKKTVYEGALAAIATGREVWVAEGFYPEWSVIYDSNPWLFGGFAGNETKRNERDPEKHETILSAWGTKDPVLRVYNGEKVAGETTIVDGFSITDGLHSGNNGLHDGAGIICSGTTAIISGNKIHHNKGTGVSYTGNAPYIACNNFQQNQGTYDHMGGVVASAPSGHVLHNIFNYNGSLGSYGAGAVTVEISGTASNPTTFEIRDNVIENNWGKYGGGVTVKHGTDKMVPVIRNNIIRNNSAYDPEGPGDCIYGSGYFEVLGNLMEGTIRYAGPSTGQTSDSVIASNMILGGKVAMFDGHLLVANNTFVRKEDEKSAVDLEKPGPDKGNYDGPVIIKNNIFTGYEKAIYRNTDSVYAVTLDIANNDFYGNATNYDGLTPGTGDLFVDPRFANPGANDYHLAADSPLVDKGLDAVIAQGWIDCDGEARIVGAHVDIGADEYVAGGGIGLPTAQSAMKVAAGLETVTPALFSAMDVVNTGTSQGKVDIADAVLLLRLSILL